MRRAAFATACVVMPLLVLELGARLVYRQREGHGFGAREPVAEIVSGVEVEREGKDVSQLKERLHPYFGLMFRPGYEMPVSQRAIEEIRSRYGAIQSWDPLTKNLTNNYGFFSPVDYPFLPSERDDSFVIGVFGGSVGVGFALLGKYRLIELLEEGGYFGGREPVVLTFANGGYKQPQQLLILAYFLSLGQEFDLVLNLDGLNEMFLGSANVTRDHIDPAMPAGGLLLPLLGLLEGADLGEARLAEIGRIQLEKRRLERLAALLNRTPSAALHLGLDAVYRRLDYAYRGDLVHYAETPTTDRTQSLYHLSGVGRPMEDHFEGIAQDWARSSLRMRDLAEGAGARYVHVLQPNQYYSRKPFGRKEKRTALLGAIHVRLSVEKGYPELLERVPELRSAGVAVVDATPVYDGEPRPVYTDNCCHVNLLGNELLAEHIAAGILADDR